MVSGTLPNITYLPSYPFSGTDTFAFGVTDSLGAASVGTVTIDVGAAPAATIVVNTTAQEVPSLTNGNCTLAEAIKAANSNAAVDGCAAGSTGTDIISVPAGTYTLALAESTGGSRKYALPFITSDITIKGAGIDQTKILRGTTSTDMTIFYSYGRLTLQGMTIGNSQLPTSAASNNPAVLSSSQLTVVATKFINNATGNGAAITNESSGSTTPTAIVRDSVFMNNAAFNRGGAIYSRDANLTVTNSVFFNNNGFDRAVPVQGGTSIWTMGAASFQNNCFLDAGSTSVLNIISTTYPNQVNATNNWWGDSGTAVNASGVTTSPSLTTRPTICDLALIPSLNIAAADVAGLISAIQYANSQSSPITINLAANSTYIFLKWARRMSPTN